MKSEMLLLSKEIDAFIAKYAKIKADFDPEFDDEEDRFNGPDASMMEAAAKQLADGQIPLRVHSDWGSGCYDTRVDSEGFKTHEDLVARIYKIIDSK